MAQKEERSHQTRPATINPSGHASTQAQRWNRWLRGLSLYEKALRAAELDNFQAVSCADLMLHAVKMIFYSLFGQAKLIRDFLVCQPASDQRNDLLLAPGKA